MTLIAEDLFLLLFDDESGKSRTDKLQVALGGAVLVELALTEAVTVEEKRSRWRSAKVQPVPGAVPADPVLVDALATVAEKDRSAQDLVNRLGKGLAETLGTRLVGRGILERRDERVLGFIPRTRWPALDASHEEGVRRQLTAVLVEGAQPEPRVGALVALLHAVDLAHKTVAHEGISNRDIRKRAKEIAQGDWAAKAVRDAIQAANDAVMIAVIAAGGAAAASGGS
jgi:hypothetical protein